jgi:hypothetical protein
LQTLRDLEKLVSESDCPSNPTQEKTRFIVDFKEYSKPSLKAPVHRTMTGTVLPIQTFGGANQSEGK